MSKMISARFSDELATAITDHAVNRGTSQSEALSNLVRDALDLSGREGLEMRLAAAEAKNVEQERIVRRLTGRGTPRTKRMSIGMSLAEAAAIEKAAQAAGMTRGEFLRDRIFGSGDRRPLHLKRPALPEG